MPNLLAGAVDGAVGLQFNPGPPLYAGRTALASTFADYPADVAMTNVNALSSPSHLADALERHLAGGERAPVPRSILDELLGTMFASSLKTGGGPPHRLSHRLHGSGQP